MATYSINIGTPTESTKVQDLQTFLNKLPDNTAQLISPRDTRDAIFTTWENILIKETSVASSSIGYIGLDSDTLKAAMLIGKKAYTTQEILDDTLLNSDTDLFIFNGKSDSNPSLQDTKVSFLAGLIPGDYYNAPYIEATKIVAPSRIDLEISNPATAGVIQINADQIELGNSGWIINDTGALYPVVDGQDLGATPSNRIGNLYMSSRIDYADDLKWTVGSTTNMVLTTGGILSIDTISASTIYGDSLQITTTATAGYVLTSDGIGNANWLPTEIVSPGVTAGYIIVADGLGNTSWQSNAASSAGPDGSIQFAQSGILSSDNTNFYWDNINKRMGINTNTPGTDLDVSGGASFSADVYVASDLYIDNNVNVQNEVNATDVNASGVFLTDYFIFATAGFGINKVLTSDGSGNATWESPVVGTGPNNSIQLSDGTGALKYDTNFRWSTNYGSNILEVAEPTYIGEYHGDGVHIGGALLMDSNTFVGFNTYYNSGFKRIDTGYSSWIKQENTGSLNLYVSNSGASGSTITTDGYIEIDNSNGFVGLNISPVRQLHVNGAVRLQPISVPSSPTQGDMYFTPESPVGEWYVHDFSGPFKIQNRDLYQIDAFNMFGDNGIFDSQSTNSASNFKLYDRHWFKRYQFNQWRNSQCNLILPKNYIAGRDIEVIIHYTFNGFIGTKNIKWKVGLVQPSGSQNIYSNDLVTQYIVNTHIFKGGTYNWFDFRSTFVFDGTNLNIDDKIGIICIRDLSDTYNNDTYIKGLSVRMV